MTKTNLADFGKMILEYVNNTLSEEGARVEDPKSHWQVLCEQHEQTIRCLELRLDTAMADVRSSRKYVERLIGEQKQNAINYRVRLTELEQQMDTNRAIAQADKAYYQSRLTKSEEKLAASEQACRLLEERLSQFDVRSERLAKLEGRK